MLLSTYKQVTHSHIEVHEIHSVRFEIFFGRIVIRGIWRWFLQKKMDRFHDFFFLKVRAVVEWYIYNQPEFKKKTNQEIGRNFLSAKWNP